MHVAVYFWRPWRSSSASMSRRSNIGASCAAARQLARPVLIVSSFIGCLVHMLAANLTNDDRIEALKDIKVHRRNHVHDSVAAHASASMQASASTHATAHAGDASHGESEGMTFDDHGALFQAHWSVQYMGSTWDFNEARGATELLYEQQLPNSIPGGHWLPMQSTSEPLPLLPRSPKANERVPRLVKCLRSHVRSSSSAKCMSRNSAHLSSKPTGSIYVDIPRRSPDGLLDLLRKIDPAGHPGDEHSGNKGTDVACLRTRQPKLRNLRLREWTVEVVVLFSRNTHFGQAWQGVLGRTGSGFSSDSFDRNLSAMGLKLTPDRHLLLEAWGVRPVRGSHFVSIRSNGPALSPETWYHIVGRCDGSHMRLYVNGALRAQSEFGGDLAVPPLEAHGDFTLGCGMHANALADPCSCLIAEARVTSAALEPSDWLWNWMAPRPVPSSKR